MSIMTDKYATGNYNTCIMTGPTLNHKNNVVRKVAEICNVFFKKIIRFPLGKTLLKMITQYQNFLFP